MADEYVDSFKIGSQKLRSDLAKGVEQLRTFEWDSRNILSVVYRAAVLRQYDALAHMLNAVDSGFAEVLIPALRPAFEEVVWLKFLSERDLDLAERLASLLLAREAWQTLSVQLESVGSDIMGEWGFTSAFLARRNADGKLASSKLQSLAVDLGWPQLRKGHLPSMKVMAKLADEEMSYAVIYHATSRTVHFSMVELLRRAWGSGGRVTIGTTAMQPHWAAFLLCYASRFLIATVLAAAQGLQKMGVVVEMPAPSPEVSAMLLTRVPIVTPDEFNI